MVQLVLLTWFLKGLYKSLQYRLLKSLQIKCDSIYILRPKSTRAWDRIEAFFFQKGKCESGRELGCGIGEILNIRYLTLSRKSLLTLALEANEGKESHACLRLWDADIVHPVQVCSDH